MTVNKIFNYILALLVVLPAVLFSSLTKDNFIIKEAVFAALVALGLVFLALYLPVKEIFKKNKLYFICSALFLLSVLISAINARHPMLACEQAAIWFLLLGVPLLVSDKDFLPVLYRIIGITFALSCIYGLLQYLNLDPFVWASNFDGRPGSFFGNPNFFAGYLTAGLPVILVLIWQDKKFRALWSFIFILGLFNLFVSRTRGAWIGFAASMIFIGLIHAYKRRNIVTAVSAVIIILVFSSIFLKSRLQEYFNPQTPSVIERVFKWKTAIEMIKDHPFIGVGAGNLKVEYALYQQKIREQASFQLKGTSESNVHNEYLQQFAETGIIGLISFIALFGYVFFRYAKEKINDFNSTALAGGIIACLVFSLSNFPLRITPAALLIFIFCGIILDFNYEKKFYIIPLVAGRYLAACAFLIFAVGVAYYWIFIRLGSEYIRHQGDMALASKSYAQAVNFYSSAIKRDYIHSERTSYDLGEACRAQGNFEEALKAYSISVDLRNYGEVYHNIGNCYYLKKDFGQALKNWEVAYALGLPDDKDQSNLKKNIEILEKIKGE